MERTDFKFSVIRDTLAGEDNVLTVTELCGIAGVSRSGYYTWLRAEQTRRAREAREQADFQLILAACRFRGYDKGARGIHMRLLHTGVRMNVKKIRRLMRNTAFSVRSERQIRTAGCKKRSGQTTPPEIW